MMRLRLVTWIVAGIFLLLGVGLLNLEVIHGRAYRELGNRNCIRLVSQDGSRGRITDRQGQVIADSRLSYDLMLLPQDEAQKEKIILSASRILLKNARDLSSAFNNGYISSSIPVTIARNIGLKEAIALDELKVDLPAIIVQANPLRHYPQGKLASHVLGYVSEIDRWRLTKLEDYGYKTKDIVGFGGVEEKYDYYLRQEEGGISFEVDHRGKFIRTLGFKPPLNGKDIQLTLNIKIQKIAEDYLSGRKGCVIIMDPYTGEIFAMASSPAFKPEAFAEKNNSAISSLLNNSNSPLMNRAVSAACAPASVFKLVVASAALENKKINLNTSFVCQGSTLIGRREFKCWNTHGAQNLQEAITHSCDVFFYKTGLLVGPQGIHDYALKLGFARTSGFELPYEVPGFIPSPLWRKINKFKNWFDGDTANMSIGQGEVLVTPLQVTRMLAVFANGGYLVTPYIVKAIDGRDLSAYQRKSERVHLRKGTIDAIKEDLKSVVSSPSGTANVLASLPVSVAGKTGTAQAPPRQAHAWFTGFFPSKNPKFVICVFLEHGGPGYVSCVVAKQIIQEMNNQGLI
ncbi:MAG: penicillin-binding protein 2 [Candidatus Omnitrophica bacterium]|nr:penicillin-binding protein 2 [Candidatus Omnitrophota bacterium]